MPNVIHYSLQSNIHHSNTKRKPPDKQFLLNIQKKPARPTSHDFIYSSSVGSLRPTFLLLPRILGVDLETTATIKRLSLHNFIIVNDFPSLVNLRSAFLLLAGILGVYTESTATAFDWRGVTSAKGDGVFGALLNSVFNVPGVDDEIGFYVNVS